MNVTAVREQRIAMPPGMAGVDLTIQEMSRAAMGQWGAGSERIRDLAVSIIRAARVPERDQMGEVVALKNWVQDNVRYVRDPLWYESITFPESIAFDVKTGDCDDHVVLLAALLGAVGIPSRFVTFGIQSATQTHVAMEAQVKGEWIPLDPIVKNKPAGWQVPDPSTRVVYGPNTPFGTAGKVLSIGNAISAAFTLAGIYVAWRYVFAPMFRNHGRRGR